MTELRTPLRAYERDAGTPLRRVSSADATADLLDARRAVWGQYLGDVAAPAAAVPLATSWIALVLDESRDDDMPEYVPGSFYPGGFRRQVLDGCGMSEDPTGTPAPSVVGAWLDEHAGDPAALGAAAAVRCALVLNLLSRYEDTVRLFAPVVADRHEPHLFREVARAAYAAGRSSDAAAAPFAAVATSEDWDLLSRLAAAIRLIAHYSRSGHAQDVEQAATWAELGTDLRARAPEESAIVRLYDSHLERALALHHWRRRDGAAMVRALRASVDAALDLQAEAATPADLLAARHAERLVREAELKAFVGRPLPENAAEARRVADRAREIDPADPYIAVGAGDAYWILGDDERCLDSYRAAVVAGTFAGAQAADRAAQAARAAGAEDDAAYWRSAAADLDGQAA